LIFFSYSLLLLIALITPEIYNCQYLSSVNNLSKIDFVEIAVKFLIKKLKTKTVVICMTNAKCYNSFVL